MVNFFHSLRWGGGGVSLLLGLQQRSSLATTTLMSINLNVLKPWFIYSKNKTEWGSSDLILTIFMHHHGGRLEKSTIWDLLGQTNTMNTSEYPQLTRLLFLIEKWVLSFKSSGKTLPFCQSYSFSGHQYDPQPLKNVAKKETVYFILTFQKFWPLDIILLPSHASPFRGKEVRWPSLTETVPVKKNI